MPNEVLKEKEAITTRTCNGVALLTLTVSHIPISVISSCMNTIVQIKKEEEGKYQIGRFLILSWFLALLSFMKQTRIRIVMGERL